MALLLSFGSCREMRGESGDWSLFRLWVYDPVRGVGARYPWAYFGPSDLEELQNARVLDMDDLLAYTEHRRLLCVEGGHHEQALNNEVHYMNLAEFASALESDDPAMLEAVFERAERAQQSKPTRFEWTPPKS